MANLRILIVISALVVSIFTSNAASFEPPTNPFFARVIVVDQSGCGNYTRIQDAVDAVPLNNSVRVHIWVRPGVYREKVVVPATKPFITLLGSNKVNGRTVITGNLSGSVLDSATVSVLASDFVGWRLTIQNTYGEGSQAVALRVSGDRASFYQCRIMSYQDTILDDTGRHFYSNCFIQGATDFICGNAASIFERCHIHSTSDGAGAITAQQRQSPTQDTGFTFVNCIITGEKSAVLGRPWGNYSRVIFALTYMSEAILPQGWDDWGVASRQRTAYYGQYKCYGPGANTTGRVAWSHNNLTSMDVEPFISKDVIDGKTWIRPNLAPFYADAGRYPLLMKQLEQLVI